MLFSKSKLKKENIEDGNASNSKEVPDGATRMIAQITTYIYGSFRYRHAVELTLTDSDDKLLYHASLKRVRRHPCLHVKAKCLDGFDFNIRSRWIFFSRKQKYSVNIREYGPAYIKYNLFMPNNLSPVCFSWGDYTIDKPAITGKLSIMRNDECVAAISKKPFSRHFNVDLFQEERKKDVVVIVFIYLFSQIRGLFYSDKSINEKG